MSDASSSHSSDADTDDPHSPPPEVADDVSAVLAAEDAALRSFRDDADSLKAAVARGDAAAECVMGITCVQAGQLLKSKKREFLRKGIALLEKAAQKGFLHAMHMLAVVLGDADSACCDLPQAAVWMRRAAERGMPEAMFGWAQCLWSASGCTMDREEGRLWYRRAEAAGHAGAGAELRDLEKASAEVEERQAELMSDPAFMFEDTLFNAKLRVPIHSICRAPRCPRSATLRCGSCQAARYCGAPCQRRHWAAHKASCRVWAAAREASIAAGGFLADDVNAEPPPPPPPPAAPQLSSPSDIRGIVRNMRYMIPGALRSAVRRGVAVDGSLVRFLEDDGHVQGLGLSLRQPMELSWTICCQTEWRPAFGAWGPQEWARLVAGIYAHLEVKATRLLSLGHKLQDRPTLDFFERLATELQVLLDSAEFGGGPAAPRRLIDVPATIDRDQDYALQFDLRHARRAAGFGIDLEDHSARPALTFHLGKISLIKDAKGKVYKNLNEFLDARLAGCRVLPTAAPGAMQSFRELLSMLLFEEWR